MITYTQAPVLLSSNIEDIKDYFVNNPVPETHAAMLFFAETNCLDINMLVGELNVLNINFFGGIFPSLIFGDRNFNEGVLINIFPIVNKPYLITGLDKAKINFPCFKNLPIYESNFTGIVLIDGFASSIGAFLSEMYDCFGNGINLIGGGAGSLSLKQQPCLFNNDGLFQDAAIICLVEMNSKIGIKHGWKTLEGPFIATKTEKNIIKELNWRPAFDVYKEVVENDSNQIFTSDNFFDIAKAYPFGMAKGSKEIVVRDPIMVNENEELICVGEVAENTALEILKGRSETLLEAAEQITSFCDMEEEQFGNALIFDCISRSLFLGDDFEKELSAIQERVGVCKNEKICGVLTLGEIASSGVGSPEFYNKTIVLGILYG